MGNGEDVKIAAHDFINHVEPINFCRPETAILVFSTHYWKTLQIMKNSFFR